MKNLMEINTVGELIMYLQQFPDKTEVANVYDEGVRVDFDSSSNKITFD